MENSLKGHLTAPNLPLVVDLDYSLIRTDLLYECFIRLVFSKVYLIFIMPLWLAKGIPFLKMKLAEHTVIDVAALPYNQELLRFLSSEKSKGRELILCTATYKSLAEAIAEHLQIFNDVFATEDLNLTGSQKAKRLVSVFGEKGFCYAANDHVDLKVWRHAASAITIDLPDSARKKLISHCPVELAFDQGKPNYRTYLKAMRVHQWAKNVLLFVPLITAHRIFDEAALIKTLIAFLAFGLCASATYIINDLSDLESDRAHWKKQHRPLASGALPIKTGIILCAALMCLAFVLAFTVSYWFVAAMILYVAVTLGYSFLFKRLQTVDIVTLAGLYTIRLFAGGAAAAVMPSFWLLSFSMFVFLALAIVKRISEILKKAQSQTTKEKISGRGYYISDLDILRSLATSAGMVSILVFAMYVNSSEVVELYRTPFLLWLVCPAFGYWIVRMLIMASRGEIDEDPITFAIKDKKSWLVGAILTALLSLATFVSI